MAWILGVGTLVLSAILIGHLLLALVLIIPTWRICTRAGFPAPCRCSTWCR